VRKLVIVADAIPRHAGDSIAAVRHQPLDRRPAHALFGRAERVRGDGPHRPRWIGPALVGVETIVVFLHVDDDDAAQGVVLVRCVRGFLVVWERQICNPRWRPASIAEEVGHRNVAVVRWLGADGRLAGGYWLPRRIAVVCSLVHVDAHDVVRCAPEVEIYAPERGPEAV